MFKGIENSLVSIIIPVYNVEDYLPRCMESILNQTHSRLEVILVNDGSTDTSPDICENYAKIDSRVKVVHQQNTGVSVARNTGLDVALGEWITFVDSDDYIDLSFVEKLLNTAVVEGTHISACGYIRQPNDQKYVMKSPSDGNMVIKNHSTLELIIRNDSVFPKGIMSKLYHKILVEKIRFDLDLHVAEDRHFLLNVVANYGGNLAYLPEGLYYYCHREGSLTTTNFSEINLSGLVARERYTSILMPISERLVQISSAYVFYTASEFSFFAVSSEKDEFLPYIYERGRPHLRAFLSRNGIPLKNRLKLLLMFFFPRLGYRIYKSFSRKK